MGAAPAQQPLSVRRNERRRVLRTRIAATHKPLSVEVTTRDILQHPRGRFGRLAGLFWLLVTVAAHAALTGFFIVSGVLWRNASPVLNEAGNVFVNIVDKPAPMPPETNKPDTQRAPKPKAEAPKVALPPPDPVQSQKPVEPQEPPQRRVVGLSFESTVTGGGGPGFAVGNTRMGQTDKIAVAPQSVENLPGTNKVASVLPSAGDTFVKPQRKNPRPPPYPESLKRLGVEADVVVFVSLDEAGKVVEAKIIKPANYPEFNEAALAAARTDEFSPALKNGLPVPYSMKYTYRFRMDEG